jgi:DNA-binding transcriptional regulator YhcF (GntR family)
MECPPWVNGRWLSSSTRGARSPSICKLPTLVMREIHRGRFRPGDALPGYRSLAEQLGASRNTGFERASTYNPLVRGGLAAKEVQAELHRG